MKLTENIDLFKTVFDSAPNGIALMKPVFDSNGAVEDFIVLLFNAYTSNWIGDIDYKGKRYGEIFPAAKSNGIITRFIQVAKTGVTANFECWYDGEGIHYWFRFTAVKQDDLIVVTTEDITTRKQTEIALQAALETAEKQKRLYHSITNNTPDLVYVFGLDYTFNYANKALLEMWGKTAETAIGVGLRENGYEEWHALLHEREIDEVAATKKSIRGTVSFPHAELGSRVYDYILVPVINELGEVEAVAGTTRDITELKQAENKLQLSEVRLKTMIDQTPAATLVLMGDDLIITQVNKAMLGLIGFGEEAVGMPLLKLMPELSGQYIWEQVINVYRKGVNFDQYEVEVSHKRTGVIQPYYYNIAYRPLKENGEIIGMIQVAIDVTEQVVARKKLENSENRYKSLSETLEQQVQMRTQELLRSNEDLQQFAHVASHDLREPVRKVKMFTGRLKERLNGQLDEAALQYFEKVDSAADRMFTMIEGVLAYSTTNAVLQQPEAVNLTIVMQNIESDLEVVLQNTSGTIEYQNLPVIEGAQVLLYQLFYNLINNSIKFTKAGIAPRVILSSKIITENQKRIARITLQDNGIGFEPDQANRIFETFTRLNSKDKYEGTGLGLALCKKIVERHGGSIVAEGSRDHGARFIIMLPLDHDENGI